MDDALTKPTSTEGGVTSATSVRGRGEERPGERQASLSSQLLTSRSFETSVLDERRLRCVMLLARARLARASYDSSPPNRPQQTSPQQPRQRHHQLLDPLVRDLEPVVRAQPGDSAAGALQLDAKK